jgi:hypothetical protein
MKNIHQKKKQHENKSLDISFDKVNNKTMKNNMKHKTHHMKKIIIVSCETNKETKIMKENSETCHKALIEYQLKYGDAALTQHEKMFLYGIVNYEEFKRLVSVPQDKPRKR